MRRILVITVLFLLLSVSSLEARTGIDDKPTPAHRLDGIIIHSHPPIRNPEDLRKALSKTHYLVRSGGEIQLGRKEDEVIGHIRHRFDSRSLAVSVEGEFGQGRPGKNPAVQMEMPGPQKYSLMRTLFTLMDRYDIPLSQVERHTDYNRDTSCPGLNFPYFQLLYDMSKQMLRDRGNPLLEDICRDRGISVPIENARLVVEKSRRRLDLYAGKILLKSYRIGLSRNSAGDKERRGDRKTPVGTFRICEKYPMRAWMEITYPTPAHAKKGLEKGIISRKEHDEAVDAWNRGGIPRHNTALGYDIGFHAGGFAYGKMPDQFTAGCIGLEDPEAFEVFRHVPIGAVVIIRE